MRSWNASGFGLQRKKNCQKKTTANKQLCKKTPHANAAGDKAGRGDDDANDEPAEQEEGEEEEAVTDALVEEDESAAATVGKETPTSQPAVLEAEAGNSKQAVTTAKKEN